MANHCEDVATNDNAKKVIQACEDSFAANETDCNKFLKAVAAALGVTGIPSGDNDNANTIINALELSPSGWTKLDPGSHQEAYTKPPLETLSFLDCSLAIWKTKHMVTLPLSPVETLSKGALSTILAAIGGSSAAAGRNAPA